MFCDCYVSRVLKRKREINFSPNSQLTYGKEKTYQVGLAMSHLFFQKSHTLKSTAIVFSEGKTSSYCTPAI